MMARPSTRSACLLLNLASLLLFSYRSHLSLLILCRSFFESRLLIARACATPESKCVAVIAGAIAISLEVDRDDYVCFVDDSDVFEEKLV